MKFFKPISIFFLFLCLIFPFLTTQADTSSPLQVLNVRTNEQFENFTYLDVNQNTSTREGVEDIEIYFNAPCTMGSVTLQDAGGNQIPLTESSKSPASEATRDWYFNVSQPGNAYPLKWNTTYTLTIHGGSTGGWQDQSGNTLPTDVTYTFTTSGAPVINQYMFQDQQNQVVLGVDDFHLYNAHELDETDTYSFHSLSGPVPFFLTAEKNTEVLVQDATGKTIYQRLFPEDHSGDDDTIQIPQEGDYTLTIAPGFGNVQYAPYWMSHEYTLNIQGPHLAINNHFAQVDFQNMNNFQTHNTPFALGIQNTSDTRSIDLLIDGKYVKTVADGSFQTATVDPTSLANGVHLLTYVTHATDSSNGSTFTHSFLVDRNGAFVDVPSNFWDAHEIDAMHALRIINGVDATHFSTQGTITRAEFATLLAKTMNLPVDANAASTFADVPNHAWYTPYVEAVAKAGYMVGQSQGSSMIFSPTQPITRADAATVIGHSVIDRPGWQDCWQLQDFSQVPDYAKSSVATLYYMSWMLGYPDGKFHPANNMSRAEAAKLLSRALGI